MNTALRHRIVAAGVALALVTTLASCSDDDTDAASGADDPTEVPAGEMTDDACDAAVTLSRAVVGPDGDDVTGWVQSTLQPAAETIAAEYDGQVSAPGTAAEMLAEALVEVAESGDIDMLFESDEVAGALSAIGSSAHRSCGFQTVDVLAREYAFDDLPSQLDAGMTSFALTNRGVEDHEIVIFRRADGVSESLDELLELPEEEAFSKIEFTGVAFGGPGSTTYTAVDLQPGTYFVVCFIPVGGGEDGPPHVMEGMSGTFTVA
jgi:hypothetical protein